MFRHIERYPFFRLFRGIVVSAAVKLIKPDPAIFEHLAGEFALDFGESVFIDDLPANVETARRLVSRRFSSKTARSAGASSNVYYRSGPAPRDDQRVGAP